MTNQKPKLEKICDFAEEIIAGAPIQFCRSNYDCRYLMEVYQFKEKRYCLKRLEQLKQQRDDEDSDWVEAVE